LRKTNQVAPALRKVKSPFDSNPQVLVTRPREQATELVALLHEHGFAPVRFPAIAIRPIAPNPALDAALERLADYDWVVFTSVNGVRIAWERALQLDKTAGLQTAQVAAIGPKTAAALRHRGVSPAFVPAEYVAEAILPGLGDLRGRRVLLLRAAQARQALPQYIRRAGGQADEIPVYETVPGQPSPSAWSALRRGVDYLTFTSPSTARYFVDLVRRADLDPLDLPGAPRVVCIGPITAAAARQLGFVVAAVARPYTAEGLADTLVRLATSDT